MRKLIKSIYYVIALIIILIFHHQVFSQIETYSVAAKWELYSVKDQKVSFLMPRLPILIEGGDQCFGEITQDYAAYTDGVVYTVRITSKAEPRESCLEKRKFDEKNFVNRVNELKQNLADETNSANNISKDSIIKLTGKDKVVKLINDFYNKRWFEFAVYGADEAKTDVKNFLASFKIEKQTTGIEIGQGAEQVFGDDVSDSIIETKITNDKGIVETVKKILVKTDSNETRGITVIMKPRANYTEGARQTQIQGKVVLRVNFYANGAIGNVSVISGLRYGLTEEAVKAARKIVFLPAQRDGVRYSVTKPVEYNFYIY
jgi:TonB family protein